MLFPGNKDWVDCYLYQVSRNPPPPLPGGYTVGEKVFCTVASQNFPSGDKVVHGEQGVVMGPNTGERCQGTCVAVRFPGNKRNVDCYMTSVRRLRRRSAHATLPASARRPRAGRPPPSTDPTNLTCKPLQRRLRWRSWVMPGTSRVPSPTLPFVECAQVSRDAPPAPPGAAADQDEVAVVGERTFAQRDAECRKRAIDLEAETPRNKRVRGAAGALEERVVRARSVCTVAVDKRARELTLSAFDEYMADQIDEATFKQRKAAAREKATAEHVPLTELERASAEYTEAVSSKAEAALATLEAAEDAAEARLEAVMLGLEGGHVKAE